MWRWFPLMVSLSHVSVMNPKFGLKSKMVEWTSSILGARDVFASIKLRPNTLRHSIGRSVMTGNVLSSVREFPDGNREVFVPFSGDTGGTERLFVLLAWKVLPWIFNKLDERLCKLLDSWSCVAFWSEPIESSSFRVGETLARNCLAVKHSVLLNNLSYYNNIQIPKIN